MNFDVWFEAKDDSDLANVSLYYRYSSDNSSWSYWKEWAYNNTISGTSSNGAFSFAAESGDGFYEFYTIASDSFGNIEAAPLAADAIARVHITGPAEPSFMEQYGWVIYLTIALAVIAVLIAWTIHRKGQVEERSRERKKTF